MVNRTDEKESRLTFEQLKAQTAEDLRAIAALLEERAKAIEAGDMAVMDELLGEDLPKWRELLMFRHAHREERRGQHE